MSHNYTSRDAQSHAALRRGAIWKTSEMCVCTSLERRHQLEEMAGYTSVTSADYNSVSAAFRKGFEALTQAGGRSGCD